MLRDYTGPMTLVPMELCEDFSFPWVCVRLREIITEIQLQIVSKI